MHIIVFLRQYMGKNIGITVVNNLIKVCKPCFKSWFAFTAFSDLFFFGLGLFCFSKKIHNKHFKILKNDILLSDDMQ